MKLLAPALCYVTWVFSRPTATSANVAAVLRNDLAEKSNQDFNVWKQSRRAEEDTASTTTIDVYYHVFINNITDGDDVDDSILEKQTAILNEAYSGKASTFYPTDCDGNPTPDGIDTSFRFRFAGVTRTEDSVEAVQQAIDNTTEDEVVAMLMDGDPALFKALQGLHGNQTLFDEAVTKVEEFKNMTRQDQLLQFLVKLSPFQVLSLLYGRTQRVGDCSTLNVWVLSGTTMATTFGVATRPHWCGEGGMFQDSDGVLLHRGALPDSNFPEGNPNDLSNYTYDVESRGDTLVHEVGHWLNLEHPDSAIDSPSTGRTGCDYLTGDFVVDTPASSVPSSQYCTSILGLAPNEPCCPIGADTCPHRAGEDPATNYMSYSSDCCTNSFTEGQILRMKHSWEAYRDTGVSQTTPQNWDEESDDNGEHAQENEVPEVDTIEEDPSSPAYVEFISACATMFSFALLLSAF
jgi:hypothetical protein